MRRLLVLIGAVFDLLGIVAESLYSTNDKVAYNGVTISPNAYISSGLFLILFGLVLLLPRVRIPDFRLPDLDAPDDYCYSWFEYIAWPPACGNSYVFGYG